MLLFLDASYIKQITINAQEVTIEMLDPQSMVSDPLLQLGSKTDWPRQLNYRETLHT